MSKMTFLKKIFSVLTSDIELGNINLPNVCYASISILGYSVNGQILTGDPIFTTQCFGATLTLPDLWGGGGGGRADPQRFFLDNV